MVTYPEDWKKVKLGEVLSYTQPTNFIENNYVKHGAVPVLTAGKSFILGYSNKTNSAYQNLPTILFDDFTTEVRYLDYPFMVKSSATKFLNIKNDDYDVKFLFYWLDQLNFQIEAHERHWISRFSKFNPAFPLLREQQSIASTLSDFDEHIDNLTELIEKKKAIRDGALEDLVSGRTRIDGFDGEWKEELLDDLVSFINGQAHEKDMSENGKYIVVNSKFISTNGDVKKRSNKRNQPANSSDILMVMSDLPNGKALGKCYYVEKDNIYTVNQRICVLSNSKINSKLLYYLTNRNKYFLEFDDGVNQTNLRREDVLNCLIKYPVSRKEQQAIASVLTAMDEEIESIKVEKEKMIQIREGAMDDLLTGRVRLKV